MTATAQRRDLTDRSFHLVLVGLTVVGVAVRLLYLLIKANPSDAGEAQNVAFALATGRGFADAYFVGAGPTAHLAPTMVLIAGAIHGALGLHSPAAAALLEALVLALVFGSFWLMAAATDKLGMPRIASLAAFAALAAVPIFVKLETFWFRYWEGALALFLQSLVFAALAWNRCDGRRWPVFVLATVPGLLAFVLPPLGIAAAAMTGIALLWQRQWRRLVLVCAGILITSGIVFTPWVARNMEVMHRPILLRSNLGLELALGAGEPIRSAPELIARTVQIHPFQDGPGRRAFVAEGELGYFDRLLSETERWIAAHPWQYAGLLLRHARQTVVADSFEFGIIDGSHPRLLASAYDLVAVLGIVGLGVGAWRIDRRLGLPLVQVAVLAICYAPFQPVSRYLYVNYAPLMFGASLLMVTLLSTIGAKVGGSRRSGGTVASD